MRSDPAHTDEITPVDLLPVVAAGFAVPQFVPQIRKLRRTGDTAGLSTPWGLLTGVNNTAWFGYFVASHYWFALIPSSSAALLGGGLGVMLHRRRPLPRRRLALIAGWALVLAATAVVDRSLLGAALTGAYLIQVVPAVVAAHRTDEPTGIARGTWCLILAEVSCWTVFGAARRDGPLLVLGVTGVAAALLVLHRARAAGPECRAEQRWTRLAPMTDSLAALDSSVRRLADLVRPLDDDALVRPAYPSEWSIADVLSHIGSGAVIFGRMLDDGLAGTPTPDDFNPSVWDRWNAMAPRAQADECLVVDRDLVTRLEAVGDEDRARLQLSLGPMELDWETFLQMRLSEHLLHEWDVAVALDPAATLADDGTAIVVDRVGAIAGWASKPVGDPATIAVATTGPERAFTIAIGDDVALTEADATEVAAADATLTMPAEALVRLVYGRLDADHTPAAVTGDPAVLERLRPVFPGF